MRCKYCNVDIDCKTKICPLCHEKIDDNEDSSTFSLAYPAKRMSYRKKIRLSPTSLYLAIALTIFIICIPFNLLITPSVHWFGIVGIAGLYGLVLVRHTILSNNSLSIKIFGQLFAIFCVLLVVNYILKSQLEEVKGNWIWDYGLPTILIVSSIVVGIYTAIAVRWFREVIVDAITVSCLGFLPVILYAFNVVTVPYLSIACACVSAIIIIFCGMLGRKALIVEFKKRFHV